MALRQSLPPLALAITLACGDNSQRAVAPRRDARQTAATASLGGPAGGEPARTRLDSVTAVATALYERGAYDSSRFAYREVLATATALGDSASMARALTSLGLVSWRLADYAEARLLGEQGLALKHRLDLRPDLFRSYNALGLLARDDGRAGEALVMFDSALGVARELGDRRSVAKVRANQGLIAFDLGDYEAARLGFVEARDAARDLGEVLTEWNAVVGLASVDVRLGNPLGAIAGVDDIRRRHPNPNHPVGEENAFGQLATAYDLLGETQRAIAALDSALRIARASELRIQEAEDLKLLAEIYEKTGDRRRALGLLDEAFVIDSVIDAPDEIADVLLRRAAILGTVGDAAHARSSVARALMIHRRLNARFDVLSDLLVDAELSARAGDSRAARTSVEVARQLADSLNVTVARRAVAISMARVADQAGDARRVLAVLDSANVGRAESGVAPDWEIAALRARAHRRLGHTNDAIAHGQRAVAGLERIRRALGAGELRTALVGDNASVYADLVLSLLDAGRVTDALEVADRSRSRALLDHLVAARLTRVDTAATSALMTERARVLARIDALLRKLATTQGGRPPERGALANAESNGSAELATLQREYDELMVRYPMHDVQSPLLGEERMDIGALRRALRDDEALLEFFVTDARTLVFVVRRASVRVVSSAMNYGDLLGRVRLARDLAANLPKPDTVTELGMTAVYRALHDGLIAPVAAAGTLVGVRRLVIVPHGVLAYLPFAALTSSSGRALVEDYTLLYVPVAAALPVLRRNAATSPGARPRVVALAPFPQSLPSSRGEARRAAKAADGSIVFEGPAATELALRRALATGAIVHVASHGVMATDSPMFSRVELGGGNGSPADDGRLEVHELLSLRVTSPLVFLSGCETGSGRAWSSRYARTSDHATLEQAFLYAGASTVIATRWAIEDASAAAVAERFYAHLGEHDPAEALALAQRDMIHDRRFRHPHYWAAYAVSGSGLLSTVGNGLPRIDATAFRAGSSTARPAIPSARSVSLMSHTLQRP